MTTDLVERPWFRRDPVTGNFVQETPPVQFTPAQLMEMMQRQATVYADLERAKGALAELILSCFHGPPNLHDGCGTTIIGAPSVDALRKASDCLNSLKGGEASQTQADAPRAQANAEKD